MGIKLIVVIDRGDDISNDHFVVNVPDYDKFIKLIATEGFVNGGVWYPLHRIMRVERAKS